VRQPPPPPEVEITEALVRQLLEAQHPDLAALPLRDVGAGWDNAVFTLGGSMAVRLPRRALAAPLISNEQRWMKELAPRLPLAIPVPLRLGVPGQNYPWPWSVIPWFEGAPFSDTLPVDEQQTAFTLASFLNALHVAAPDDAPSSSFRGLPLSARSERVHQHVGELDDLIDGDRILRCWDRLVRTAPWSGPRMWLHGDLHPGNLIVANGRLTAVIDFGDLTAGEPATDLAAAWMLFSPLGRTTLREALHQSGHAVDDAMWLRAQGWTLALNLAWLTQSGGDAKLEHETLTAIEAVLSEQ
jgi:aminoglycoside phosphotransferase (APT) family kinase protein